jgi:hypothetical protein
MRNRPADAQPARARRSVDDQEALLSALRTHARDLAQLPRPRLHDCGVQRRRRNVAQAWAWLASYVIGRDYAADLFEDLQLAAVPTLVEHTADELNALLGTMSFWARLSADQRDAIATEHRALYERLGRAIRASTAQCLLRRDAVRSSLSVEMWPCCHAVNRQQSARIAATGRS